MTKNNHSLSVGWLVRETNDPFALKTLVLNADMQPLDTWPLHLITAKDAINVIIKGNAEVVEEWDVEIHSPSITMKVPKVIVLKNFAPVYGEPKFCRRSVILRDHFTCQYCGKVFPPSELTYDHVLPRAKRGNTKWHNIVMACVPCNQRKGDRTDIYPIKDPHVPTHMELLYAGLMFLPDIYREEFGDWLDFQNIEQSPYARNWTDDYWSVPLEEDEE